MRTDDAYLLDILIASRQALRFLQGVTWDEFAQSDLLQSAVLFQIEVIGEASRRISPDIQQAHPEVPWAQTIGMRNRLIHEHFQVDRARVWDTLHNDLPDLIEQIEPLVPPEE